MRAVVGRWPGNRIVVGRGGRFGVKPAEMPTAGTAAAPLQACVDPGDDNTEFVWQIGALPSSGLMAANDAGGMSHTGAADGVYTTPFHLWTLADGAAAVVDRGASSFTTSFGVSGITLVGADCAQAALSAAGAITQVHQLAGAGSSQAAASGTGSVGQVQVLAAAGSSQAAASASGAITQRHQLAAAGATQAALSGTGAIGLGSALTLLVACTLVVATLLVMKVMGEEKSSRMACSFAEAAESIWANCEASKVPTT